MSFIVILKILHYLALFLAGGLGVANSLLMKNHQVAQLPPSLPVRKTMVTLAKLALVAVVTLWVTGLPLTYHVYGVFNLGWAFYLKLIGATVLLLTISILNVHLFRQERIGQPPNPRFIKIIPPVTRTSLILVLLGIAIVTTTK